MSQQPPATTSPTGDDGAAARWGNLRWGFVAYTIGTVLVGVALAAASLSLTDSGGPDAIAAPWQTGIALTAAAVLLALIAFGAGAVNDVTYLPTLWAIAPLIPAFAAIAVVATYLIAPLGRGAASLILGSEIAAALAILGAIPLRTLATIRVAQTRSYWELRRRSEQLRTRLTVVKESLPPTSVGMAPTDWTTSQRMALAEATKQLDEVDDALLKPPDKSKTSGLEWVSAMGYVSLWRRVDRAEEALIDVEPRWLLMADALHDHFRLKDADIKSVGLERALSAAAETIDRDAHTRYFETVARGHGSHDRGLDDRAVDSHAAAAASQPTPESRSPTKPLDEPGARAILREVRNDVNNYFEDRMEGLVRARNRLWRAILLTATTTFLLVGLAVVGNVDKSQLIAASVFFLVAAVVGLFNRLRLQAKADSAVEDFNLFEARLVHTPLASGLAGLAGVILVAIAPAASGQDITPLKQIFDLNLNPLGLIVAAAFGLTPDRIVGPLEDQTEKLKGQLKLGKAAVDKDTAPRDQAPEASGT